MSASIVPPPPAAAPKPILGISKPWEYFVISILFSLVLPLLPLPIEFYITHGIKPESMTMAIAIYAVSIGVTSRSQVIFGVCVLVGVVFAVAYGVSVKAPDQSPATWVSWAIVGLVFIMHGIERYQRHVQQRTPFLEFAEG